MVDGHISVRVDGGAGAKVVHVSTICVLTGEGERAHPTQTGSAQVSVGRTRRRHTALACVGGLGARVSADVDVPAVIRRRGGVGASMALHGCAHATIVSAHAFGACTGVHAE